MSIKILPARLANQIAAGEVVERPASVVKELLENSLDAGATKIEVEIIKGGHKRVLIRDNGKGIDKEELTLALSRHATSKISTLADLENIESLGFRGEALASISSVSRLTLTSRTKTQEQAWQAQCEGRDMDVIIAPAAHPQGTSVDVQDLFFNTPARRKFLRTEKTEFTHIDELFKRAALSHYDVHFVLKHNDKIVRNYPAARNTSAKLKRVTQICGKSFENSAIEFSSDYQDIQFHGWVCAAGGARGQNDQQYVYINGRMMRDKLIAHAIRQAYEGGIAPDSYPAYVVYLTMPTHMLDVNVHPTKQEVRFHQARLVHDFIYKAINDTLQQHLTLPHCDAESFSHMNSPEQASQTYTQLHDEQATHQYIKPLESRTEQTGHSSQDRRNTGGYSTYQEPRNAMPQNVFETAAHNYQRLMQPASSSSQTDARESSRCIAQMPEPQGMPPPPNKEVSEHGIESVNPLERESSFVLDSRNQLAHWHGKIFVVASYELERHQLMRQLQTHVPVLQPLLMPIAIKADKAHIAWFNENQSLFEALNIELADINGKLVLRKIPAGYRQVDWATAINTLLARLIEKEDKEAAFAQSVITSQKEYDAAHQHILWAWFVSDNTTQHHQGNVDLKAILPASKEIQLTEWLACHE